LESNQLNAGRVCNPGRAYCRPCPCVILEQLGAIDATEEHPASPMLP
jgi:hypothetical protein